MAESADAGSTAADGGRTGPVGGGGEARDRVLEEAERSPMRHGRPAREPRANPAARHLGVIIGILLLALGALAGRELWVRNTDPGWSSWLDPVFDFFRGLEFRDWMGWVGIGLAILGLLLLIAVFKPRRRTHRRLSSPVSIWTRPVDIARHVTATARRTSGVRSAATTMKRRTATLDLAVIGSEAEVRRDVEEAVGSRLEEAFGGGITLRTRTRRADETRSEEDR